MEKDTSNYNFENIYNRVKFKLNNPQHKPLIEDWQIDLMRIPNIINNVWAWNCRL